MRDGCVNLKKNFLLRAHLEKLLEYCQIGVKEGATLVLGGKQVDRPGKKLTLRVIYKRILFMVRIRFVF